VIWNFSAILLSRPAMLAGIDMEQHYWQRPSRQPPSMRSQTALFRHQHRSLQRQFYPRVAELDPLGCPFR
jgi:hypothetical protein